MPCWCHKASRSEQSLRALEQSLRALAPGGVLALGFSHRDVGAALEARQGLRADVAAARTVQRAAAAAGYAARQVARHDYDGMCVMRNARCVGGGVMLTHVALAGASWRSAWSWRARTGRRRSSRWRMRWAKSGEPRQMGSCACAATQRTQITSASMANEISGWVHTRSRGAPQQQTSSKSCPAERQPLRKLRAMRRLRSTASARACAAATA